MRQIFSSQRVETVEGVAELLRGHGIEVKVTNGRSYKTRRRGQFSYTDLGNASAYPAVWIVRADDQPRARNPARCAPARYHPPRSDRRIRLPRCAGTGRYRSWPGASASPCWW